MVALPVDLATAVEGLCREALGEVGLEVPAQCRALAADERDGRVIALFRADSYGVCWLAAAAWVVAVWITIVNGLVVGPRRRTRRRRPR